MDALPLPPRPTPSSGGVALAPPPRPARQTSDCSGSPLAPPPARGKDRRVAPRRPGGDPPSTPADRPTSTTRDRRASPHAALAGWPAPRQPPTGDRCPSAPTTMPRSEERRVGKEGRHGGR